MKRSKSNRHPGVRAVAASSAATPPAGEGDDCNPGHADIKQSIIISLLERAGGPIISLSTYVKTVCPR